MGSSWAGGVILCNMHGCNDDIMIFTASLRLWWTSSLNMTYLHQNLSEWLRYPMAIFTSILVLCWQKVPFCIVVAQYSILFSHQGSWVEIDILVNTEYWACNLLYAFAWLHHRWASAPFLSICEFMFAAWQCKLKAIVVIQAWMGSGSWRFQLPSTVTSTSSDSDSLTEQQCLSFVNKF